MNTSNIIKPTLCLNMIVKNESKIIIRLLESVYSIIDCYCICDTGSTDNTLDLIKDFFKSKNISGEIFHEPFVNFEHNRNVSLNYAKSFADYIIFLDADMILNINDFSMHDMINYDAGHIFQGNDSFYYHNARILKSTIDSKYVGYTHEYLSVPDDSKVNLLRKNKIFIMDIGDGGSKGNKVERDIKLLKESLKDDPENPRSHFYLANTYYDSGKYEEALPWYEKRTKLNAWEQEVWYSYYRIGSIYNNLNKHDKAIENWLKATEIVPHRIENFYCIIKYYIECEKYEIANIYYTHVIHLLSKHNISVDRDVFLFFQKDVYEYKIYLLYLTFADKIRGFGSKKFINDAFNKVINTNQYLPRNISSEIIKNQIIGYLNRSNLILQASSYSIFSNKIKIKFTDNEKEYVSSSSSIIKNPFKPGYWCNLRYVNYFIQQDGSYVEYDTKNPVNLSTPVITFNRYMEFDDNFKITNMKEFRTQIINNAFINGLEDIRIFYDKYKKETVFIASTNHSISKIGIVYGIYDTNRKDLEYREVYHPNFSGAIEKNWSFVDYNNSVHFVYQWYPLTVCKLNHHTLEDVLINKEMPLLFKYVRGSTNGISYNNEIWFIVHVVATTIVRHYYHMFVIFDSNMKLKRYSPLFKFSTSKIDYCLTLIVNSNNVITTFSEQDNSSVIATYDKKYIDEFICYEST